MVVRMRRGVPLVTVLDCSGGESGKRRGARIRCSPVICYFMCPASQTDDVSYVWDMELTVQSLEVSLDQKEGEGG